MRKLAATFLLSGALLGGAAASAATFTFSYGVGQTGPQTFTDTAIVTGNLLGGVLNPIIKTQFSGSLLDGGSDGATFDNGTDPIQSVQFSNDGGLTWVDALSGALGGAVAVAPGGNPPAPFASTSGGSFISSGLSGTFDAVRLVLNGTLSSGDQLGLVGRIDVDAIPEPSTWALMIAGVILVAGIARKRMW
jgi:hypothetical protein